MGDSGCYALVERLEKRIQSLDVIKSKVIALRSNPDHERVYIKKLNDKTHEFIKSYPNFRRVHCFHNESESFTCTNSSVSASILELVYGKNLPHVDLSSGSKGWDIWSSMACYSVIDMHTKYFFPKKPNI